MIDIRDALRLFQIAAQRNRLALAALHLLFRQLRLFADRAGQFRHTAEQLLRRLLRIDLLCLLRVGVHRLPVIGDCGAGIAGIGGEGLDGILEIRRHPVDLGPILFVTAVVIGERVEPLLGNRFAAILHGRRQRGEFGLLARTYRMRASEIRRGDVQIVPRQERPDFVHQDFAGRALYGRGRGRDRSGAR